MLLRYAYPWDKNRFLIPFCLVALLRTEVLKELLLVHKSIAQLRTSLQWPFIRIFRNAKNFVRIFVLFKNFNTCLHLVLTLRLKAAVISKTLKKRFSKIFPFLGLQHFFISQNGGLKC